jgi:hypothetical protein
MTEKHPLPAILFACGAGNHADLLPYQTGGWGVGQQHIHKTGINYSAGKVGNFDSSW